MQQRKPTGRPSGTDGSDFSYRMVVDSRYTKVAKGKSRLCKLIFAQIVIQLVGLLCAYLLTLKEENQGLGSSTVALSSTSACLFSLTIGELGRKRSRVNLLKFCLVISSIAIIRSVIHVVRTGTALEVFNNPNTWETKKFELLETASILLGSVVQIFLVSTIISLIGNMSPPKKAS